MRNPHHTPQPLQIRAVILDWAGTAVDFGSRAPVHAFVAAFAELGVRISDADARGPMGLAKRDHVAAVMRLSHVAAQWQARYGHAPGEDDVDRVYGAFVPTQMAVLADFAAPIPGVVATVAQWRAAGIRIGSSTGYTAAMLAVVAKAAAAQGYAPDAAVAADQAPAGRPAPAMVWQNLQALGVWPPAAAVKIGDTVADVAEGLNAGLWSVALTTCGNEVGLSEAELAALPAAEQQTRIAAARAKLEQAGAHYVVADWSEMPGVFADINARLAAGERP